MNTGCRHSCHSSDSGAGRGGDVETLTRRGRQREEVGGAYREPSLESIELLSAHVAAISHHPLWWRLDERSRGHLRLRDEEPFPLQLSKYFVNCLVPSPIPKCSFPFSNQLQSLVNGPITLSILQQTQHMTPQLRIY